MYLSISSLISLFSVSSQLLPNNQTYSSKYLISSKGISRSYPIVSQHTTYSFVSNKNSYSFGASAYDSRKASYSAYFSFYDSSSLANASISLINSSSFSFFSTLHLSNSAQYSYLLERASLKNSSFKKNKYIKNSCFLFSTFK